MLTELPHGCVLRRTELSLRPAAVSVRQVRARSRPLAISAPAIASWPFDFTLARPLGIGALTPPQFATIFPQVEPASTAISAVIRNSHPRLARFN
jgi:hypothetical protein